MSWQQLSDETGVDTEDIRNRIVDFGLQTYWPSHHPYTIPQPFSVEPTESVSREDLDELYEAFSFIANEAYTDPDRIRTAPHNSTTVRLTPDAFDDPPITWRAMRRRRKNS
jgi:glycine dehydrogenase subunit 2